MNKWTYSENAQKMANDELEQLGIFQTPPIRNFKRQYGCLQFRGYLALAMSAPIGYNSKKPFRKILDL